MAWTESELTRAVVCKTSELICSWSVCARSSLCLSLCRVGTDAKEPLGHKYLDLPVADATSWQNLALEVICRLSQGEVSSRGFLPFSRLPLRIKKANLVNPAGWRKWAAVNSHPVCAGQRSRRQTAAPQLPEPPGTACTSSLTGQDTVSRLQGLQKDLACMTSLQSSGPCLQTRKQDRISWMTTVQFSSL